MKRPLIILTGPTAVGKTKLSIGLAGAVNGEIISADSMQVYKKMDIGTAKIRPEEMQGIKHHLIDILEPWEEFHVALFQKKAKEAMEEIYQKGKCPVIVGGTGFYIQSVLYDIEFSETNADQVFRKELEQIAKKDGNKVLHERLKETDPKAAEKIHPNNVKRVIRALEYFHQTGECISEHNETQEQRESPYRFRYYVLSLPREILYQRINERVDKMKEDGLVSEVKMLLEAGCRKEMVSMQGLGYKEIIEALEGNISFEEAFEKIKKETRHFAKRQFTWFKREKEVTWIRKEEFKNEKEILDFCIRDSSFLFQ